MPDLVDLLDDLNRAASEWVRAERDLMLRCGAGEDFDSITKARDEANRQSDAYIDAKWKLRAAIANGEGAQ